MDVMVIYLPYREYKKWRPVYFAAIPGESKDMQPIEEYNGKGMRETYFIGASGRIRGPVICGWWICCPSWKVKCGAVWHLRHGRQYGILQKYRTEGKGLASGNLQIFWCIYVPGEKCPCRSVRNMR